MDWICVGLTILTINTSSLTLLLTITTTIKCIFGDNDILFLAEIIIVNIQIGEIIFTTATICITNYVKMSFFTLCLCCCLSLCFTFGIKNFIYLAFNNIFGVLLSVLSFICLFVVLSSHICPSCRVFGFLSEFLFFHLLSFAYLLNRLLIYEFGFKHCLTDVDGSKEVKKRLKRGVRTQECDQTQDENGSFMMYVLYSFFFVLPCLSLSFSFLFFCLCRLGVFLFFFA